jgi:hypothetical protein
MGTQVFGVRGGFYVTPNFQIGGNYYFNQHFQPKANNADAALAGSLGFPQGSVRSNVYDVEFSYNFGQSRFLGARVRPYLTLAAGGLTTSFGTGNSFVLNVRSVKTPTGTTFFPNDVITGNDTFFTFSYGGGVKATRLWGPMGVFADIRGRTVPNFFGNTDSWPEVNAGLNFSWGEK